MVPDVKKIWGLDLPGIPLVTSACCGRLLPFIYLENLSDFSMIAS